MVDFLKDSRQAARVLGLGGKHPVRPKSLFYVRFVAKDPLNNGDWSEVGFYVKNVTLPSVSIKTERMNQYNKQRLVHTGYELDNITVSFYDTVNGLALRMWNRYAEWYFGDFNHTNTKDYDYDITMPEMRDTTQNEAGYGLRVRNPSGFENTFIDTTNSQYFFEKIQIFQMFGDEYIRYDLINPRITKFTPDSLDYSQADPVMITVNIEYEALLYGNKGIDQKILAEDTNSPNRELNNWGNISGFIGDYLEPDDSPVSAVNVADGFSNVDPSAIQPELNLFIKNRELIDDNLMLNIVPDQTRGPLGSFGNYDYGYINNGQPASVRNSNYILTSTIRNLIGGAKPIDILGSALGNITTNDPISGALITAAQTAIGAAQGRGGGGYPTQYIKDNLLGSVVSTVISGVTASPNQAINRTNGLEVSPQTLAVTNSQRPTHSQIGINHGQPFQTFPKWDK